MSLDIAVNCTFLWSLPDLGGKFGNCLGLGNPRRAQTNAEGPGLVFQFLCRVNARVHVF